MILGFILIESIWWWLLTVAFLGTEIYGTHEENGWVSSFSLMMYVGILAFFFNVPVFSYIVDNPLTIILATLGYVVAGTLWSFFKWWMVVNDYVKKYNKLKKDDKNYTSTYDRPAASDEKTTFAYWIAYWPLSITWFFFGDFLNRIFKGIVDKFGRVYESIEKKAFSKLEK